MFELWDTERSWLDSTISALDKVIDEDDEVSVTASVRAEGLQGFTISGPPTDSLNHVVSAFIDEHVKPFDSQTGDGHGRWGKEGIGRAC